jgi:hypothetical protein
MEGHSVDNVGVMDRSAAGDGLGDQLLQLFSHGDTWTTSACSWSSVTPSTLCSVSRR